MNIFTWIADITWLANIGWITPMVWIAGFVAGYGLRSYVFHRRRLRAQRSLFEVPRSARHTLTLAAPNG